MQIKSQLGKLQLNQPLGELIAGQRKANALEVLPITIEHVLALSLLPQHHRDPFDRLLVSVARIEGSTLLTCDPLVTKYDVKVTWS